MKAKNKRLIANWLYFGACCIAIQILLGGITRLTGSGLSITEWQPLIGSIPPITEGEWLLSFHKYQQIAQFHVLNAHFSLEDYKSIFFWEWLHRNWARFLGLAFLLPMAYFIFHKKISRKLIPALSILFLLGLLQGVIGWIMVKSGLNQTSIRVDHIKLAIHFIAALLLLCYTLWLAFSMSMQELKMRHRLRFTTLNAVLLALLVLQMIYGTFMAGSNAALAAITWPDMNGTFSSQSRHYRSKLKFTERKFIKYSIHSPQPSIPHFFAYTSAILAKQKLEDQSLAIPYQGNSTYTRVYTMRLRS